MCLFKLSVLAIIFTYAMSASAIEKNPASEGSYIAGGVVGTLFGLGIGQAINGNYGTTGWIFTMTELLSIGMSVGGQVWLRSEPSSGGESAAAPLALIAIGSLSLLAFRIWEIVDVWTTPRIQLGAKQASLEKERLPTGTRLSLSVYADRETSGLSFNF